MQLLLDEMEATFTRTEERLQSRWDELVPSSEDEIEKLVGEAIREARRSNKNKAARKISRG